jgi:hypothetical protein
MFVYSYSYSGVKYAKNALLIVLCENYSKIKIDKFVQKLEVNGYFAEEVQKS